MSAASAKDFKAAPRLTALPLPTFLPRRYRPGSLANWSGHLPFANDLIAEVQPALLVELGTHYGESYFGFCQSVLENGIDCICYAVDHWHGEEHSGFYGEEVYEEVNSYNSTFYKQFSYLLRSSFDDAAPQFAENSIDILHIDGLHTYEAGSHDFRTWFPKVKEGGIVLLHDVFVRHADFGIWKLWQELESEFGETFAFHHDWGLGVLRKPGQYSRHSEFMEALFNSSSESQEYIRRHYALYAAYLDRTLKPDESTAKAQPRNSAASTQAPDESKTFLQVYLFDSGGYSEANSQQQSPAVGEWATLAFELADGLSGGPLRIDPADRPCVAEIGSIKLTDAVSGASIWSATSPQALREGILPAHSLSLLPQPDACVVLCYGSDPQFHLPVPNHSGPVRLEVSIRIDPGFDLVAAALEDQKAHPERSHEARLKQTTSVQVFPFTDSGFLEQQSITQQIDLASWTTLTFEMPPGAYRGPVRIDPANLACVAEIAEIKVSDAETGSVIAVLRDALALRKSLSLHSALLLPCKEKCLIVCDGADPQILVSVPGDVAGPTLLEISLRVDADSSAIANIVATHLAGESIDPAASEEARLLKAELKAAQSERLVLAAELTQLATEKTKAIRDRDEAIQAGKSQLTQDENERQTLTREISRLREEKDGLILAARRNAEKLESERSAQVNEISHLVDERKKMARRQSDLERELNQHRDVIRGVERSVSWRVTAPLRTVMDLLRKVRGGSSSGERM